MLEKALYFLRIKRAASVLRQGHPLLRSPTVEVQQHEMKSAKVTDAVKAIRSVFESPYHTVCGLSAPQIGSPLSIIAYRIKNVSGVPPIPLTFLINPKLTVTEREAKWTLEYESCESLPSYNAIVRRPTRVRVDALNLEGEKVGFEASGYLAKVLHHECDHLEGKTLLERMEKGTLRHDQYIDVYENYPVSK
ncbi:peptide deformylase [Chytriomyces sp. MP71]|nr:peptide deformylase [Chytriomyces sp. MP71]